MTRVLIISNCDRSTWNFRKGQIKVLCHLGMEVVVATPAGAWSDRFASLGARHVPIAISRFPSPWRDLKTLVSLIQLIRAIRPTYVHSINTKAVVLGSVAASLCRVPNNLIHFAGLGYAFQPTDSGKSRLSQRLYSWIIRASCRLCHRALFVNQEDARLYLANRLIKPRQVVTVRGEGVNLDEYSPASVSEDEIKRLRRELNLPRNAVTVLMMVARVSWSKGTKEFVEASRLAVTWDRPVTFLLAGPLDPECPDPVPESYLNSTSTFRWLGWRSDVKQLLLSADIVALPSFYREGLPTTLLEALAMQKPIVTTDHVGCREAVDDGRNGWLVPPRDTHAFSMAVKRLVDDEKLRREFGQRSREKAFREFREEAVSSEIVSKLYCLEKLTTEYREAKPRTAA